MTNILTIEELKNSVLNANVEDEYIQPAITEAQSIYLREILGDSLLNTVINRINNDTLTGKYLTLVEDYIKPYLMYMVQSLIVVPINYKIRNAGVIQQYDNGFSTSQMKDTQYLKDYYDGKAEFYGNRLTEYLRQNASDIKEYRIIASNVTNPTTSQNVTNIFLGGTKRGKCGTIPSSGGGGSTDKVDWNDIKNKPDFATVATSGDYEDLTNKPEIPTVNNATLTITQGGATKGTFTANAGADVTIDLEAGGSGSTDWNDIQNKPDFAAVATSGSYNDLSDKPTIPTVPTNVSAFTNDAGYLTQHQSLAGYATEQWVENKGYSTFSGNYEDLTNKPTIPTKTSELTNDSGYTTFSGSYRDLNDIPSYFSYIHQNPNNQGVTLDGETRFGDSLETDISNGVFCNFKVDKAQSTKLYSDYIITGENTNGRNELIVSGDDGNNVYGKIAKDGIYEGNTKLSDKYLQINDLPANVSAFTNDAGYLTQHQSLAGYATEQWVQQQGYSTFSGDYNDLTNKPEIPTVNNGTLTIKQGGVAKGTFTANSNENIEINLEAGGSGSTDWNDIQNKPDFATVATSGSYNDLTDKPTIPTVPTNVSAFTNDAGYLTQHQSLEGYATEQWVENKGYTTFDGDYNSLTNKPELATVATTGSYNDLTDKPEVPGQVNADWNATSGVAQILNKPTIPTKTSELTNDSGYTTFSGNYNDLANKPAIPAAQVNSDWNATSGVSQILNKPTIYNDWFGTKAEYDAIAVKDENTIYHIEGAAPEQSDWNVTDTTSMAYIKNKPTIPAAQVNSDWNATSGVSQILNKPTLATVATSGNYIDLANKPTIPTKTSELTNDSGYSTFSGDYNDLTNKPEIPTVNNGTLTIKRNGTTVATFTANDSTSKTANISVPTSEEDLGLESETWTFTLADGTEVTKTVVIKK